MKFIQKRKTSMHAIPEDVHSIVTGWMPEEGPRLYYDMIRYATYEFGNLGIKIVLLGKEYRNYLEMNALNDTLESRSSYVETISDEEAIRLLREANLYQLLALPVIHALRGGCPHVTNYHLEKEERVHLKQYFERIWGEGNVFVTPYLLPLETYLSDYEDLYDEIGGYFRGEHGGVIKSERFRQDHSTDAGVAFYFLPVAIRFVPKSAVYRIRSCMPGLEDITVEPRLAVMTRDGLDDAGLPDVPAFSDSEAADAVRNAILSGSDDWDAVSFVSILFDDNGAVECVHDLLKGIYHDVRQRVRQR